MAACHVWWISPQVARWSVERASICMEMRRGKWYGHEGFCEIRSTVPVCCVCVIVCLRLRLCLCLCHVLSFTYLFTDHLLVLFTYHLPVGLSVSVAARVRAHFEFFLSGLAKAASKSIWMNPAFLLGAWFDSHFFFLVVQYLRGGGYLQARPCSPGLHPRWHQMPIFSLCLSCTNWILLAWILHTATHMYPQICAAQSVKREASVAATCSFFRPWRTLVSYDQVRDYHRSICVSITRNCCRKC